MKTIAERLAEQRPAPPHLGLPPGSYAVPTGAGYAYMHPDAEAATYMDAWGRRVTMRRAKPRPAKPAASAPGFDNRGEPLTYEAFCAQQQVRGLRIAEQVRDGTLPPPAPRVSEPESPGRLEDTDAWRALVAATNAMIGADDFEDQLARSRALTDAAEKAAEADAQRVIAAGGNGRSVDRAQRELDAIRERRTRRGDPNRVALGERIR